MNQKVPIRIDCESDQAGNKKHITVLSLHLAYDIIRAGYLHLLYGISKNKNNPEKSVWYFSNRPEVQEIVNQYIQRNKEYKASLHSTKYNLTQGEQ